MYKEVSKEEYQTFIENFDGELISKIGEGWWSKQVKVAFTHHGKYFINIS